MGSREAPGKDNIVFKDLNISAADLDAFAATGVDVSALRNAKLLYSKDKNQAEYDFRGVFSSDGKDIRPLVDQFSAWSGKKIASKDAYEAYVKAKQANPGRDATLLVPGEEKMGKSLIGG